VRDHLSAVRAVDELDVAFEELVATVERLEGSKEATGVCVCVCVCVCVVNGGWRLGPSSYVCAVACVYI